MKIALAQINTTVGDLAGNVDLILRSARNAAAGGAEVAVFPELSITGYPPRDLVEKPTFVARSEQAVERLAAESSEIGITLVCGYVAQAASTTGKHVANNAVVIQGGRVIFRQTKMLLPTYDVFDE